MMNVPSRRSSLDCCRLVFIISDATSSSRCTPSTCPPPFEATPRTSAAWPSCAISRASPNIGACCCAFSRSSSRCVSCSERNRCAASGARTRCPGSGGARSREFRSSCSPLSSMLYATASRACHRHRAVGRIHRLVRVVAHVTPFGIRYAQRPAPSGRFARRDRPRLIATEGRSSQSVGAALTAQSTPPNIGECCAPSTHTRQRSRSLRSRQPGGPI
jgi:hypothetical protein